MGTCLENYVVGDAEIGSEGIVTTIIKEFEKLILIYRLCACG